MNSFGKFHQLKLVHLLVWLRVQFEVLIAKVFLLSFVVSFSKEMNTTLEYTIYYTSTNYAVQ